MRVLSAKEIAQVEDHWKHGRLASVASYFEETLATLRAYQAVVDAVRTHRAAELEYLKFHSEGYSWGLSSVEYEQKQRDVWNAMGAAEANITAALADIPDEARAEVTK